jgi:hypothetical protein
MRIDRDDHGWAIVDGLPPAVARWRLVDGRVVLHSASGRVYEVGAENMPVSIAVGLLALRDAEAFLRGPVTEEAASYAVRRWLSTSRDRLIAVEVREPPRWPIYRFTFLAAVSGGTPHAGLPASRRRDRGMPP